MGLLRDTMAAQRLLHWKQPRKNEPGAGDFAEVVMQEVKSRSDVAKGKLSIEQVNSHLDQLARASNESVISRYQVLTSDGRLELSEYASCASSTKTSQHSRTNGSFASFSKVCLDLPYR